MNLVPARLQRFIPTKGSLTHKMMSASIWSAGGGVVHSVLRLGSNLITTRLLVPEAFGLVAIVVAIQTACYIMTDIGLARSVIREKDGDDPKFYSVAWTLNFCITIGIAVIMLILAGGLYLLADDYAREGTVYADPILPGLVALAALAPVVTGLKSPGLMLAMRRLQYNKVMQCQVGASAVGTGIMLLLLYIFPSVWILVLGLIIQAVTLVIFSYYIFAGVKVTPSLDRGIVTRQWRFGKFVLGSAPFEFFHGNGDKFIFGSLMDATTFGLYSIAMVWVHAAQMTMDKITDSVGFSGLSVVVRETPERLSGAVAKYLAVMTAFDLFAFFMVFLGGPLLIQTLYTDAYYLTGQFLAVIAPAMLFRRYNVVGAVLLAQGRSGATMQLAQMRALGMAVMAPAGFYYGGLTGAAMGVALAGAWSGPLALYRMRGFMPAYFVLREALLFILMLAVSVAIAVYNPIIE